MRFAPTAAGAQTGTITLRSNDSNRASVTIDVTGTGVAATVPTPAIEVTPAQLAFGDVSVGQTKDLTLAVRNSGNAALTVNSMSIGNAAYTRTGGAATFTLATGASQTVTVRFTPTVAGSQIGTVTIASNDPASPTKTVGLTGTGIAPAGPQIETLQIDDGTYERSIGAPGGDVYFLNRLTPSRYPATLKTVRVFFSQEGLPPGEGITVLWGSTTAPAGELPPLALRSAFGRVAAQDAFNEFAVSETTIQSGDFLVGFAVNNPPGVFPMVNDTSSGYRQRSFLGGNGVNFTRVDLVPGVTPGNFGIRATVEVGK